MHPAKTKEHVFVFEINLDKLLAKKVGALKYKEITKYPEVRKDLAILVDKNITSQEIQTTIKKYGGSLLTNIEIFDVYTGKNISENKKSMAYALSFSAKDKTLTDEEINPIMEKIVAGLAKQLGAELRK